MIVILWILLSFFVGGVGDGRKITGLGAFAISLIFSPVIGLIFALLSDKKNVKCKFCGSEKKSDDIFCPACDRDKKGVYKTEYKNK